MVERATKPTVLSDDGTEVMGSIGENRVTVMIGFIDFDPEFPGYRTVPSWRGFGSSLPCGRETTAQHQVEHTSGFFFTNTFILPSLVCWLLLTKTPRERSLTVRWTHLIRGLRYLSGVKHTIVIQRRTCKKTNKQI